MITAARLLALSALVLAGCSTAKRAAVTTFRVIDAPARYVRERIDPPEDQTTTTTTTTMNGPSDVVTPGRPVNPPIQRTASPPPRTASQTRPRTSPRPTPSTTRRETASSNTSPRPTATPTRSTTAAPTEFPTARPVPGKPGFVYSIDPNGGMVDVTGYKSGDKAKDPYTHQIFIVP